MEPIDFFDQKAYTFKKGDLEIWVMPDEGMNLCRVRYRGQTVIDSDYERYLNGATYGTALLYPTPNRVAQLQFTFQGKQYSAQMHGSVRKKAFSDIKISESDNSVCIQGSLEFKQGTAIYEEFPFNSILHMEILLKEHDIQITYTVENKDSQNLPFGLGLHPFFEKNGQPVHIQVNADKVMNMDEDHYPDGSIKEASATPFDLNTWTSTEDKPLDHVYTEISSHPHASIEYPDFFVHLDATDDFSHIVVFTPKDKSFFCIENQTCSTDAHNLYNQGFVKESGLLIVPPHSKMSGTVTYSFVNK